MRRDRTCSQASRSGLGISCHLSWQVFCFQAFQLCMGLVLGIWTGSIARSPIARPIMPVTNLAGACVQCCLSRLCVMGGFLTPKAIGPVNLALAAGRSISLEATSPVTWELPVEPSKVVVVLPSSSWDVRARLFVGVVHGFVLERIPHSSAPSLLSANCLVSAMSLAL
eukprot:5334857-Amphidinium_carterae.1